MTARYSYAYERQTRGVLLRRFASRMGADEWAAVSPSKRERLIVRRTRLGRMIMWRLQQLLKEGRKWENQSISIAL